MADESSELHQDFLRAYDAYADAIFRHCYFRIGDRERAQDLAQETFMRAWQFISRHGAAENLRALLYRIARNAIIDEIRKKKSVSLDQQMEAGLQPKAPEAPLREIIDAQGVLKHLELLAPEFREVIIMRYIDDLTPKEIAETLQISTNLVSVRINRGLEQLRKYLN